jgi:iron(III) transport system substrate-binding protein
VELSLPADGAPPEVGAVAVVRGGPRPELARQFVDWLLTPEAQELLAEYYRVPVHPEARVAAGAVTAEDVAAIRYDPRAAAARQGEVLARWRQVTGR